MTKFFAKKLNKKGFTLAELLIVVAIIAILIAVAIPIYTGAMQEAQKKVNMSNARALKGAAASEILLHWTDLGAGAVKPSGSDPAPGWIAWAAFDANGNMSQVSVKISTDSSVDKVKGVATSHVVSYSSTVSGTTAATLPVDEVTTFVTAENSGSVANTNLIIVKLTSTDISH